jgi:hypothetical protein
MLTTVKGIFHNGKIELTETPPGVPDRTEVLITFLSTRTSNEQLQSSPERQPTPGELGWPPGFLEKFSGIFADDPIERGPQGEYEVREPLE